jgi:transcriptional regulator with XRE-family HTH domain
MFMREFLLPFFGKSKPFLQYFRKYLAFMQNVADNEDMGNTVAELPEIGRRFQEARERAGLSVSELCRKIGITDSTWYRTEDGATEVGIRIGAQAAILCGTRPDAIVLEAAETAALTSRSRVAIDQMCGRLAEMMSWAEEWPEGEPAEMAADIVERVYRASAAARAGKASVDAGAPTIPPGTVIARPEPGVKTLEPAGWDKPEWDAAKTAAEKRRARKVATAKKKNRARIA